MCDCQVCTENRYFMTQLEGLTESQKEYFEGLHDSMLNTMEDNSYYKALLDGTWPNADKVIENWRKRCQAQNS